MNSLYHRMKQAKPVNRLAKGTDAMWFECFRVLELKRISCDDYCVSLFVAIFAPGTLQFMNTAMHCPWSACCANIGFKYRAPDGVLVGKMLFLTQILWVQVWMLVLGKIPPIFRFPYFFLKIKFQVNSASSKSNEYLPTFRFPYSFW